MWRRKDVFCWNICGPWIWSLALRGIFTHSSLEKLGPVHAVNKYWRLVMHPTPHQFSIAHTEPHSNSPTFICLQHFIQYICSCSPCWRMCNVSELWNDPLMFQVMAVATGNRLEGQTFYSMGLQHAAHSHIGKLCIYYKIHDHLDGQIYYCYFTTYSPQTNPNNQYGPSPQKGCKQLLYSYNGTAAWQ